MNSLVSGGPVPQPTDDCPSAADASRSGSPADARPDDTAAQRAEVEQFYRATVPKLVGWLMHATPATLDQAAEAAHQAMIDLVTSWGRVHTDRTAWVFTVARRHVLRRWSSVGPDSYDTWPADSPLLRDRTADTVRQAEDRLRLAFAIDRIAALPARQREVMQLHLAGLDHQEIARMLGCSEAAVRAQLSRARRAIANEQERGPRR